MTAYFHQNSSIDEFPEYAAWLSGAPPRNVLQVGTTSEHFEGEGWLFAILSVDLAVLLTLQ
jgi:hypothetical protein